jgi:hypothetical protein
MIDDPRVYLELKEAVDRLNEALADFVEAGGISELPESGLDRV